MTGPSSATTLNPAAPARQCSASLIDLGFVALCAGAAELLCHNAVVTFMIVLEAVAVLAIGEGTRGVTPGNMLLGLRTVRADGVQNSAASGILPAGMSRIVIKYCVLIASFLAAIIGYLVVIISPLFSHDSLRQGWANSLAKLASIDIRRHTASTSTPPALQNRQTHTTGAGRQNKPKLDTISSLPAVPVPGTQPVSHPVSATPMPIPMPTAVPAPKPAVATPRTHAIRPIPASQQATSAARVRPRQTPPPEPRRKATPPVAVPPPTPAPRAVLMFDNGSKTALTIPSTLVLGRKPTPHKLQDTVLAVPDHTGTVSRSHARLEITEDGAWISDLGSTNGTRVINQEGQETPVPVKQRVEVHNNNRIALGDMICVLIISEHRRARA